MFYESLKDLEVHSTQNPCGKSPTLTCVPKGPDETNRPNARVFVQILFRVRVLQGHNGTNLRNPGVKFKCSNEVPSGHCGTPRPNPGLQSKCFCGSLYKREVIFHQVEKWNLRVYIYILVHGDRL